MSRLVATTRRPRLAPLAAAVAAALLCPLSAGAAPALDYYQYSGAVSTWPTDLFPVSTTSPTLDLGSNTLGVGNGATGSFSALAGSWLMAGQLSVANGGPGVTGTFIATGSAARVDLGGTQNRLEVGNWGQGSATISGGALLDATVNAAACSVAGAWCNNFIGNAAGSTAALTVTGAGSELKVLRYLGVGHVGVFTQAVDGFDFGTPGGTTRAQVNVLAGGTLRSQNTSIGNGPSNTAALGTERSFVDVVIDGSGSQWIVSRNSVDNGVAQFSLASHANATATMQIRNGGKLQIDGSGSAGPFDGSSIGLRGVATVTVTGAGSSFEIVSSRNPYINIGASFATGRGTLEVLDGGTVSSLYMSVGRNGGNGTLRVDGAGSLLTLAGVGVAVANSTATGAPAGMSIGRDGGTGNATVSGGGRLLITDNGGDGRASTFSPGLTLGRGVGGTGSLTITGPGSKVEIVATSLGLAAGQPDNFNPFVGVGYDNPGTSTGTLRVENGGKLILAGNAVSTVANARATTLNIGGRSGTAGNGSATVTGLGSEIRLDGYDALINVGRTAGASGRLDVLDQAQVFSISMAVGVNAPGTVNIDNASIALAGHRTDSSAVGAGVTIGRGVGGVGVLNLRNAATLTISPTVLNSGMSVGGDPFASGGSGTVTLTGGSSIVFGGALTGNGLSVARSGTGSVALTGASFIDVGTLGTADFGREASAVASLSLIGGSSLRANEVAIGGRSDTLAGGSATATVSGAGSVLRAQGASGFISVGRGGEGDLQVSNQASVAGIVLNVGRAVGGVGTMTVDNASITMSGQQTSGSAVGAAVSIGNRGGTGTLDLVNNSQLTISNPGSEGVRLNVGGTSLNPGGTGHLNVSNSTITMSAPGGVSRATIGRDGTGIASFSAGSRLDNAGGEVIIAGEPGSVGQLTLASGSVLNAAYVGVGSKPGGIDGGTGTLIVNDSTVNTTTLEIGSLSKLGGSGGVINGFIINRGTISPGNSPGRLIVNGGINMATGAKLVLDVESDGSGGFRIDELVLTSGTTYNFAAVAVTFNFLGSTDPQAFANTGGLALDSFLRVRDAGVDSPLSTSFAPGTSYQGLFSQASFGAASPSYTISNLNLANNGNSNGSFGSFTATPVPEPAAWLMMALGLAAVGRLTRRRPARSAA